MARPLSSAAGRSHEEGLEGGPARDPDVAPARDPQKTANTSAMAPRSAVDGVEALCAVCQRQRPGWPSAGFWTRSKGMSDGGADRGDAPRTLLSVPGA